MDEKRFDGVHANELQTADEMTVSWGDELETQVATNERAAISYASRTSFVPPDVPALLAGADPNRQRLLIRNMSAFGLMVGTYADVFAKAGYFVPAGDKLETFVQPDVYGIAVANDPYGAPVLPTAPIPVSVWTESSR